MDKRAGDRDALLLAARERVGASFFAALKAHLVDDGGGAIMGFIIRTPLDE